jgi:hypothetical protein
MNDKILTFLKETELKNATVGYWGIGTLITRGVRSPIINLKSLQTTDDQFVIGKKCDVILPIIAETIRKMSNEIKDRAIFDVPTASFCSIMYEIVLGRITPPNVILITVKPLSDASPNILLSGYCLGLGGLGRPPRGYVKKMHDAIVRNAA